MTLAEIRQRIEKGCGDELHHSNRTPEFIYCCKERLCSECKTQLKLLDEIEGEIKVEFDNFEYDFYGRFRRDLRDGFKKLKQKLLGVKGND